MYPDRVMGSNERAEAAKVIKSAVEKAGGLVTVALVVSAAALVVACVALAVASRVSR